MLMSGRRLRAATAGIVNEARGYLMPRQHHREEAIRGKRRIARAPVDQPIARRERLREPETRKGVLARIVGNQAARAVAQRKA